MKSVCFQGSDLVSKKDEGNVVFRVGDFSLDGYPDLIALVREKTQNPMILENVPCTDCISNASRYISRNLLFCAVL